MATRIAEDTPAEQVETVVIGAGVIGLAVARALALRGQEVLLLEAGDAFGTVTSSRNSEVIHAGIYYPAGSLMATLCVEGRHRLYDYCAERGVGHARCGKLILATTEDERQQLQQIAARAARNGVDDLVELDAGATLALEPALAATGALLSPSTGILDSHGYMLSLLGDLENAGGLLILNSPVMGGTATGDGIMLQVGGTDPVRLHCRRVVNAAGLAAPALARNLTGMPPDLVPTEYYAKGDYFALTTRSPFRHLIYPVPVKGGLGVHLTLDLAGRARFGPDIEWIDSPRYDVDPDKATAFSTAIRRYYPGLPDNALTASYSGVRPKIVPPQVAVQDFMLQGPSVHGVPGLVNLFGIESPGLTSSLALADHVAMMLAAT